MGLLDQAQQPAASAPQGQPGMVNVQDAQAGAAQKMDKLKRLVLAGQKILYTPPASQHFLKFVNPEELPQSAGEVAAMVVAALIDRGREQGAPPDLIMPAGVTLVGDILSYAGESYDIEIDEETTKAAIQAFLDAMTRGVQQGQGQPQAQAAPQQPQPGVMQ